MSKPIPAGRQHKRGGDHQCPYCELYFHHKVIDRHYDVCPERPESDDETENESPSSVLDESPTPINVITCRICQQDIPEDEYQQHEIACMESQKVNFNPKETMSRYQFDLRKESAERPVRKGDRIGTDAKWARIKRPLDENKKPIKRPPPESGMDHLKLIAGSNLARDFKRPAHYMAPKAFDAWQQVHDKKGRYVAEETDIDGDEIDDFVVMSKRKYNKSTKQWEDEFDEDGQPIRDLVAVNGWTTVNSDYNERKQYLETHPTPKDRKGKPFIEYIHGTYFDPDDRNVADEYGFPLHSYIEKRAQKRYDEGYKHKIHMPLPTARNVFMKKLVWQAYKDVVDVIIKARPELKRENITIEPGYVASTGSKFWKAWVLEAMFEEDRNDVNSEYYKLLETYKKRFNNAKFNKDAGVTFDIKNPEHIEKFEKTLLKKDSYRTGINKLVKELVDPKGPYYEKLLNRLRSIFNSEIKIV